MSLSQVPLHHLQGHNAALDPSACLCAAEEEEEEQTVEQAAEPEPEKADEVDEEAVEALMDSKSDADLDPDPDSNPDPDRGHLLVAFRVSTRAPVVGVSGMGFRVKG